MDRRRTREKGGFWAFRFALVLFWGTILCQGELLAEGPALDGKRPSFLIEPLAGILSMSLGVYVRGTPSDPALAEAKKPLISATGVGAGLKAVFPSGFAVGGFHSEGKFDYLVDQSWPTFGSFEQRYLFVEISTYDGVRPKGELDFFLGVGKHQLKMEIDQTLTGSPLPTGSFQSEGVSAHLGLDYRSGQGTIFSLFVMGHFQDDLSETMPPADPSFTYNSHSVALLLGTAF